MVWEESSDREAGSAPTGCNGVGIPDLEGLTDQVIDKVDHRSTHINERQIVNEDGCSIPLDGVIVFMALVREIKSIGKARAAATFHRDAQSNLARLVLQNRSDALCRSFR